MMFILLASFVWCYICHSYANFSYYYYLICVYVCVCVCCLLFLSYKPNDICGGMLIAANVRSVLSSV